MQVGEVLHISMLSGDKLGDLSTPICIIHRQLVLQRNIQNSFLFVNDGSALFTICLCRGEETEVSQDHTIFGCERNKAHVLLSDLLIQFSYFSILHLLKNQSMYANGHGFLCN